MILKKIKSSAMSKEMLNNKPSCPTHLKGWIFPVQSALCQYSVHVLKNIIEISTTCFMAILQSSPTFIKEKKKTIV